MDIRPGSLVRCIDTRPRITSPNALSTTIIYRVVEIYQHHTIMRLRVEGLSGWWYASRFTPIPSHIYRRLTCPTHSK